MLDFALVDYRSAKMPQRRFLNKTVLVAVSILLSQTLCYSPAAFAADGDVRIAGQVVLSILAPENKEPVAARADTIQTKLNNALAAATDRSPASVKIVYYKGIPVITLGGYEVALVDEKNAKAAKTTPALLAQKWANGIKAALANTESVQAYVNQLEGNVAAMPQAAPPVGRVQGGAQTSYVPPLGVEAAPPQMVNQVPAGQPYMPPPQQGYSNPPPNYGYQPPPPMYGQQPMFQGSVVYAPAGLNIPITLNTAISTDVAKPGDLIQATVSSDVPLGNGVIPVGSIVTGQVTDSLPGRFMSRSGLLTVSFNKIQLPNGTQTPITAHLVGDIGKYAEKGQDTVRGEGWGSKFAGVGLRTLAGAGTGAALGTAVGGIAAESGAGAGRGAWSGTAIGAGAGLLEGLVLRKGKNVLLSSGTQMELQLDSPVTLTSNSPPPPMQYTQQPYQGQYR
jgi:hypothetical protein